MEFGSEENVLELLSTSIWGFLMASFKTKSSTNRRVPIGAHSAQNVISDWKNIKFDYDGVWLCLRMVFSGFAY